MQHDTVAEPVFMVYSQYTVGVFPIIYTLGCWGCFGGHALCRTFHDTQVDYCTFPGTVWDV